MSYLFKLEELIPNYCDNMDVQQCIAASEVPSEAELTSHYNSALADLTNTIQTDLGVVCAKLCDLIRTEIDAVYENENPQSLIDKVEKVLDDNSKILEKANRLAKRFTICRFLKTIKNLQMIQTLKQHMGAKRN